jgi:hypothetical protein
MAYKFKIEGAHSAALPQENVESVHFFTQTPKTNDGRGTDTAVTMLVKGKIRSVDESTLADETINLAKWATEYNEAKAYSKATATAEASGQVLRNDIYPNAFVVAYSESFDVTSGVGTFDLTLRQKKDLLEGVENTGGYTE